MNNAIAIDIGGTFTDVVLRFNQKIYSTKVLTSHTRPSEAVLDGIVKVSKSIKVVPSDIALVLHGTTLATNALIERSGAKTALLTTAGHRDILEMAFENRFEQYDVNIERPAPLVPRKFRIPIDERLTAKGNVFMPLSKRSVEDAIELMSSHDIESVAIGFLHSYTNDSHERTVASMVGEKMKHVSISLSSEVCPEIREYERLSTTCANAYVLPMMDRYLKDLTDALNQFGFRCPYLMMTSGGGLTSFEIARRYPIRLVESGPAGGAILAETIARELNLEKVLSFDMGGTTAKLCLVDEGQTQLSRAFEVDRAYRFKKGSGLPIRIPVIDMVEIGAGGGSVASIDALKRLQIGPESAGSQPGPACYGQGGEQATVTDADSCLGRLDPTAFAGGAMQLDVAAARMAVQKHVADPLDLDVDRAALGVAEIVDENMSAAARSHASEWGKNLPGRTMIAFGGAAPLHAARLIEKMDLARVVIPHDAGVGSAIGFLSAPISYEVVRSRHMLLSQFDAATVEAVFTAMRNEAHSVIATAAHGEALSETATAFVRYVGQGHEITVPFDQARVSQQTIRSEFERSYRTLYGQVIPDADLEIMSWTLNVATASTSTAFDPVMDVPLDSSDSFREQPCIEFDGMVSATIVPRDQVSSTEWTSGPALIVEHHTTTVVPSGFRIRSINSRHLILERITP